MSPDRSRMLTDPRIYGVLSTVGIVVGLVLIPFGSATLTTVGVVVIILSVVAFLLAVGFYFADDESSSAPEYG